jgi:hypothetical protein
LEYLIPIDHGLLAKNSLIDSVIHLIVGPWSIDISHSSSYAVFLGGEGQSNSENAG